VPNPPLPGKKGAAYVLHAGADQNAFSLIKLLGAYWNFSWGLQTVPEQPSNVEFVPMQWGGPSVATLKANLNTYVVPYIKSGQVKRLLGFNEPDAATQANLSPNAAIALWPHLEALGIPLCSPSCVVDLPIANDDWLELFMNQVAAKKYRVDYIGLHWYGVPSVTGFQSYLQAVYTQYKRPILITEFAVADWSANATKPTKYTPTQVLNFMKAILPWLEEQSWILGYSWFSYAISSPNGGISALFDQSGNLTNCGLFYQSVTVTNPQGNQTIGTTPPPTTAPTATPTATPVATSSPVLTATPVATSPPAAPTATPASSSPPVTIVPISAPVAS
jgi:hypothetical protein